MTGYAGGLDKKLWLLNHEVTEVIEKNREVNYVTIYLKMLTCRRPRLKLNQLGVDFEAVDIVQNT